MNRAERRRLNRADEREPVISVRRSDINAIKEVATNAAIDKAFILMLAIPTMILHDKYSQLMRKEKEGKSREKRFVDLCLDLYDSYKKGYVTLDDLNKCLWEEAGIRLEIE